MECWYTYSHSIIRCDSASLKSSRNWEDLEELEGKEYDLNLLFERNNGTKWPTKDRISLAQCGWKWAPSHFAHVSDDVKQQKIACSWMLQPRKSSLTFLGPRNFPGTARLSWDRETFLGPLRSLPSLTTLMPLVLIAHVPTVVVIIADPATWDAPAIVTLELVSRAGVHSPNWKERRSVKRLACLLGVSMWGTFKSGLWHGGACSHIRQEYTKYHSCQTFELILQFWIDFEFVFTMLWKDPGVADSAAM